MLTPLSISNRRGKCHRELLVFCVPVSNDSLCPIIPRRRAGKDKYGIKPVRHEAEDKVKR